VGLHIGLSFVEDLCEGHMKFFVISITFFAVCGIVGVHDAAFAVTIQNNISVRSSTGGNSVNGTEGAVSQGGGQASMFIETVVDGDVVQHVEEKKESQQGEPVHIEKSAEYQSDAVQIHVQGKGENSGMSESSAIGQKQEVMEDQEDNSPKTQEAVEEIKNDIRNTESKPLMVSVVEFFRNLFSRFFS
jgi:hypothetical protein